MKNVFKIFTFIIVIGILSLTIYGNLPFTITRKAEIDIGNKIIKNIEYFRMTNRKLPDNRDWQTLESFGYKKDESLNPIYTSDEKGNYELVYVEGFDGPYLMWSSQEKKWKIDFPKIVD